MESLLQRTVEIDTELSDALDAKELLTLSKPIDDFLFIGSLSHALNGFWLVSKRIAYMVDCVPGDNLRRREQLCVDLAIRRVHIPFHDFAEVNLFLVLIKALPFLLAADSQPTLVHCQCGISRSAAVVTGFLVVCQGMPLKRALEIVSEARPLASPRPEFLAHLVLLERALLKLPAAASLPSGVNENDMKLAELSAYESFDKILAEATGYSERGYPQMFKIFKLIREYLYAGNGVDEWLRVLFLQSRCHPQV